MLRQYINLRLLVSSWIGLTSSRTFTSRQYEYRRFLSSTRFAPAPGSNSRANRPPVPIGLPWAPSHTQLQFEYGPPHRFHIVFILASWMKPLCHGPPVGSLPHNFSLSIAMPHPTGASWAVGHFTFPCNSLACGEGGAHFVGGRHVKCWYRLPPVSHPVFSRFLDPPPCRKASRGFLATPLQSEYRPPHRFPPCLWPPLLGSDSRASRPPLGSWPHHLSPKRSLFTSSMLILAG